MSVEAEANDRAVILSEEVEFLEWLLTQPIDPDIQTAVLDRRDIVRDAIRPTDALPDPNGAAEEGYPMPEGVEAGMTLAELPDESEPYDPEDDLGEPTEDDLSDD